MQWRNCSDANLAEISANRASHIWFAAETYGIDGRYGKAQECLISCYSMVLTSCWRNNPLCFHSLLPMLDLLQSWPCQITCMLVLEL